MIYNIHFLTSIIFEGSEDDQMIYNSNGLNNIALNPITIGNDATFYGEPYNLELIAEGDILSLVLPEDIDITWSSEDFNVDGPINPINGGNDKEIYFNIDGDIGDNQYQINDLFVDINDSDISANVRLKNVTTEDLIGYNPQSIRCGLPEVSIDDNYSIWFNAEPDYFIPEIEI